MNSPLLTAVAIAASALVLAGCSSSDDTGFEPAQPADTIPPELVKKNSRGAVEVALGEPVTLTNEAGAPIITIANSRLDATGCKAVN